jgi:hypothetical protein
MHIYRTTPTRSFSTFGNALLRDRSISWCAAGVLVYLLSLPNGARASIRALAEQRKEGRTRIADALRELEESGYLRRLLRRDPASGELRTVYEVFDTPHVEPPEEVGRNQASGESDDGGAGPLPKGEKTGEQEPPSPAREEPMARRSVRRLPRLSVPEQLRSATELLLSLGRRDPRLTLGTAEAVRLAPRVEEWRAAGATDARLREALTSGLPTPVLTAPGLIGDRLTRKMPVRPEPPVPPAPRAECPECGVPVADSAACRACAPPSVNPAHARFRDAAARGRAKVRATLGTLAEAPAT